MTSHPNNTTETQMTRTFGVEIEAVGVTRARVAREITAAGIPCEEQVYNHHVSPVWKVVTDGSLTGSRYGFEVVSPILSGEDGLRQVDTVMRVLTRIGARVNKSCGLHVHIGAVDFSLREFRNIAKNYVVFEDFFDAIMPPSRRASQNPFIKSNRARFGGYDNAAALRGCQELDACRTIDEIIRALNGNRYGEPDRYFKLNLTAYWRHRTIEFRQHSGTIDAEKATNWIRLLLQFVDRAAVTRQQPNSREVTAATVFHQFFRSFKIDQIQGLKPYFSARRTALHAE